MKNILVINVNWVGDVIFSSPVFRSLKKSYPQARIVCLAVPRVCPILERIPDVDDIIVYDEKGRHWSLFGKISLVMEIRKCQFDAVFILHKSYTRALLAYSAGIPERVGYGVKNRRALLTHSYDENFANHKHRSDYYLNLIEQYGVPVFDRATCLSLRNEDVSSAREMLASRGVNESVSYVIVNAGGNWDLKRWPPEYFMRLIDRLHGAGQQVVLTGAAKDVDLGAYMESNSKKGVINLTGKTTLNQLMGVIKLSRLFISADSGPLHIASSLGVPTVAIFGPTRPEITGPRGAGKAITIIHDVGCNQKPCYHLKCPDNICMQSVSVDQVMTHVREIIH